MKRAICHVCGDDLGTEVPNNAFPICYGCNKDLKDKAVEVEDDNDDFDPLWDEEPEATNGDTRHSLRRDEDLQ